MAIPADDPAMMSDKHIRFDEFEDVLASIELVALLAPFVREQPQYWKGGHRSSRTDRGAQVVPPADATVRPWPPANSRVSNLRACCALGPPACAAPCSCHHEACSARSAWPHPGKACQSV